MGYIVSLDIEKLLSLHKHCSLSCFPVDSISPERALCSFRDKAEIIRQVSSSSISNAVKRAAKLYGLDPKRYSSHSLRSGGATAMFLGGSSDATVQLFGRWTSDAYKAYVRIETSTNEKLATKMIKSLGGFNSFNPYLH